MWKNTMGDKYPQLKTKSYGFLKKTMLTTVLAMGLSFTVVHAADDSELSTIFHVYIDGEHIGTVDSKEDIQSYIIKLIDDQEKEYEDYSFTVEEEISYVAEKVFDPTFSNQDVIDYIEEAVSVKVNAYELKIGDKVVGYFKDKETAQATLDQFKAKYVDLETIKMLEEASLNEQEVDSTLSVGDSKVLDVSLSEKVSFSAQKVSPNEVLTEKQGEILLEKGTLEDKVHKVEEGEVLGSIAEKYDLDIDKVLELNPSLTEESTLQIGQEINVTDYQPFLNVIVIEEELAEEKIGFEREVIKSDDLYKGDTKVEQEGKNGTKQVHYSIEEVNGNVVSKEVLDEKVTNQPVKEIIIEGTKVVPSRGSGEFQWPAVGGYITSHVGQRWGSYHKGMDIAGVSNRSILAADNGTVVSAGWDNGGYGNKIVINHNNGYKTVYAHLSSINVSAGQTVTKGSKLGVMGSTGDSTGVHLHFEVYKNGSLINPENVF